MTSLVSIEAKIYLAIISPYDEIKSPYSLHNQAQTLTAYQSFSWVKIVNLPELGIKYLQKVVRTRVLTNQ